MPAPDLYTNRMGAVLVIAPNTTGRLAHLAERRRAVLNRETGAVESCLSRWIFRDVPGETLRDAWGNPYDHQVRSLLAGSIADGEAFLGGLRDAGFEVAHEPSLFVPLQKLDASDADSSDLLRARHPRAFAIARRERASVGALITALRDSVMLGGSDPSVR